MRVLEAIFHIAYVKLWFSVANLWALCVNEPKTNQPPTLPPPPPYTTPRARTQFRVLARSSQCSICACRVPIIIHMHCASERLCNRHAGATTTRHARRGGPLFSQPAEFADWLSPERWRESFRLGICWFCCITLALAIVRVTLTLTPQARLDWLHLDKRSRFGDSACNEARARTCMCLQREWKSFGGGGATLWYIHLEIWYRMFECVCCCCREQLWLIKFLRVKRSGAAHRMSCAPA